MCAYGQGRNAELLVDWGMGGGQNFSMWNEMFNSHRTFAHNCPPLHYTHGPQTLEKCR